MKILALFLAVPCIGGGHIFAADLTDPVLILERCRAVYKDCATRTAEGEYRSVYGPRGEQKETKGVRVLFSRADRLFRLDWTEVDSRAEKFTQSIFTRGGKTCFYWGELHEYEVPENLSDALDAAAGISSGLTSFLPRLLLGAAWPLELESPVLRAEEIIDGQPCYLVAGKNHRSGDQQEVAITKASFAVRRLKAHYTVQSVTRQQVIERLKVTDPAEAAKLAAKPSPPSFTVDAVTDYPKTDFDFPVKAADCDYPMPEDTP